MPPTPAGGSRIVARPIEEAYDFAHQLGVLIGPVNANIANARMHAFQSHIVPREEAYTTKYDGKWSYPIGKTDIDARSLFNQLNSKIFRYIASSTKYKTEHMDDASKPYYTEKNDGSYGTWHFKFEPKDYKLALQKTGKFNDFYSNGANKRDIIGMKIHVKKIDDNLIIESFSPEFRY